MFYIAKHFIIYDGFLINKIESLKAKKLENKDVSTLLFTEALEKTIKNHLPIKKSVLRFDFYKWKWAEEVYRKWAL